MKKRLAIIKNERGFLFIYVIWTISILLISLSILTVSYQHDLRITDNHIDQLKTETLFQRSKVQVQKDIEEGLVTPDDVKDYSYPDGQVQVQLKPVEDGLTSLIFDIYLDDKNPFTSYVHYYGISE